jgi:SAM-dependent methyltransferase
MESMITTHKRDWEELAAYDARWAILTRRDRKGGRWTRDEFYATGEAEVARALTRGREFGRPRRFERALDFGCGTGRLTRALASHFTTAVGVDISERMVEMAREENADAPKCEFVVGNGVDLSAFEDDSFDFVYCNLVLQHLPDTSLAERFMAEFLRVVTRDGLAVFQMPARIDWSARPMFRRRLYAVLRRVGVSSRLLIGAGRSNPMRMNFLPSDRVRSVVEAAGGRVLVTELDPDAPPQFNSTLYYTAAGPEPEA